MTNELHISEEQLVLLYYGEAADAAAIESHLAQCEHCRVEYRAVQLGQAVQGLRDRRAYSEGSADLPESRKGATGVSEVHLQ